MNFKKIMIIALLVKLSLFTISPESPATAGYNLQKPDARINLPGILREISGISIINETSLACVQDEKGILFIYDTVKSNIIRQGIFGPDGDYEGITLAGNNLYILRSDAAIFEIVDFANKGAKVNLYYTGLPALNNEGLCYDEVNNRLLIGCKSNVGKGKEFKNKRMIFGFDLATKKLIKEPVYVFELETIKHFMKEHGISLEGKINKQGKTSKSPLKFRISALAFHPVTGKLFLLSAVDHLLFIFDRNGSIRHIEKLDHLLFNKPEGITFFKNGDMLISNEGEKGEPTILRFNY